MDDRMDNKITLYGENGEQFDAIVDDTFDVDGVTYLVLCEDEDSEDAFLFKIEYDEDEKMVLVEVTDDDEFERINKIYLED